VEKFLDCGLPERGFARMHCERCKAEFLVAFSCKARILCPSCHAKRLEIWSDWLHHELLYAVPHRQYVFTVPKRLRPFFLYDRRLLGVLSRVACPTLQDFIRATLREPDLVPGIVVCIQTHGSLVNFHPHLHLLVTDGAFRPDSTYLHLGYHVIEVLPEAFRRAVLREFVRLELLTEDDADSMLQWPHSGFHVHHSVRLEADDVCGPLQVARYSARAPIILERLQYDARKQQVTLQSDKQEGPTAGTHVFPALELLVMLLVHVPDTRERLVREYGAYSARRRARSSQGRDPRRHAHSARDLTRCRWRHTRLAGAASDQTALGGIAQADFRGRSAPLRPLWGEMRIISFILDPDVTAAILRHLQRKGRGPRSFHEPAAFGVERAPP
jgi:hypothetical protein